MFLLLINLRYRVRERHYNIFVVLLQNFYNAYATKKGRRKKVDETLSVRLSYWYFITKQIIMSLSASSRMVIKSGFRYLRSPFSISSMRCYSVGDKIPINFLKGILSCSSLFYFILFYFPHYNSLLIYVSW